MTMSFSFRPRRATATGRAACTGREASTRLMSSSMESFSSRYIAEAGDEGRRVDGPRESSGEECSGGREDMAGDMGRYGSLHVWYMGPSRSPL